MRSFFVSCIDLIRINCIAPVCTRCGSYFPKQLFCCTECAQVLFSQFGKFHREQHAQKEILVSSLLDWKANASDSLSMAVHLLKLSSARPVWKFLAEQFAEKISLDSINEENTILIPIPGHKPGSTHTEHFSHYLSEILGLRKVNLLGVGSNDTEQKKRTKLQRLNHKSNFYVDFTKLKNLEKVENLILIDDIVTTGATIGFCVDLLKRDTHLLKHSEWQAWVLFRRTENSLEYSSTSL